MEKRRVTIATRKSVLALWQTNYIKGLLELAHPGIEVDVLGMTTQGDKIVDQSLSKIGGKGLFVKELEDSLLDGRADLAVHSMKDVGSVLPDELCVEVICKGEDPRDAFVSNQFARLKDMPNNAIVGTSSLRRACQLHKLRPDVQIKLLRGNLDTRLRKLDNNKFDAIILAAAGLHRLNLSNRIRDYFSTEEMLPAVGQGAIGIEVRKDDQETKDMISVLNYPETQIRVKAERSMNAVLGGSCQVPIGGYAIIKSNMLILKGCIGKPDGSLILYAQAEGDLNIPEEIGAKVAKDLLSQGAQDILDEIHANG